MNGFELHNQKHSSASSINTWATAPDVWISDKIFGNKQTVGPAAHRGNAVEWALVQHLAYGVDVNEATEEAIKAFDIKTALCRKEETDKDRENIRGCVAIGVQELHQFGKPFFEADGKQHKIELLCNGDGWSLPVIGYLDLVYPEQGLIIDIKTTLRSPSEMSIEHQRQAAIYRAATGNSTVKFLYLTPKKAVWHECTDVAGVLADCKEILNRQERFLRENSKTELAAWNKVYQSMYGTNGRERFPTKSSGANPTPTPHGLWQ